jgi:hypothetical protein
VNARVNDRSESQVLPSKFFFFFFFFVSAECLFFEAIVQLGLAVFLPLLAFICSMLFIRSTFAIMAGGLEPTAIWQGWQQSTHDSTLA